MQFDEYGRLAAYRVWCLYGIRVPRARAALSTSFRHYLAIGPLWFQFTFPVIRAVERSSTAQVTSCFNFFPQSEAPDMSASRHVWRTI